MGHDAHGEVRKLSGAEKGKTPGKVFDANFADYRELPIFNSRKFASNHWPALLFLHGLLQALQNIAAENVREKIIAPQREQQAQPGQIRP